MMQSHHHDSLHDLHQSVPKVREHLIEVHRKPAPQVDRMIDGEVLTMHHYAHLDPSGPTAADRAAGIAATTDAAIAGALRLLARKHLGELDHAHLPLPGQEAVPIVATDNVQAWLEGWAVRIENGAAL